MYLLFIPSYYPNRRTPHLTHNLYFRHCRTFSEIENGLDKTKLLVYAVYLI